MSLDPRSKPVVQVSNLRKSFGSTEVLHGISFTIHHGEVLAIIGPSGGGKSTLLRCVTNLEAADEGSIQIGDDFLIEEGLYKAQSIQRRICLKMGLVFQNYNLFPHFSVLRNITEAQIHVLHRSADEARARATSLLDKVGLGGRGNAYPCELSGGQQQRVAIARALALDPEVLFFDEPTSALDPELTGEILQTIRALAADHMTMAIVTHEMAFARDVADRILFLDGGVIAEEGSPSDLFSNPKQERTRAFLKHLSAN